MQTNSVSIPPASPRPAQASHPELDEFVRRASELCSVSIAYLCARDGEHWIATEDDHSTEELEVVRELGAAVMDQARTIVLEDATEPGDNGEIRVGAEGPRIRFRAGFPLATPEGSSLGALCLADRRSGPLDESRRLLLLELVREATIQLELAQRRRDCSSFERRAIKAEAQLDLTQSRAQIGSWEWDLATDEVKPSHFLRQMAGLEPTQEATPFGSMKALIHPDDRELVERAVLKALADKKPFAVEWRIERPDGSIHTLESHGQVMVNEDGAATVLYGTTIDVTERKHQTEALHTSNDLYRRIVDATGEGVWMLDRDGRTKFANENMAAMLGFAAGELLGMSAVDFVAEEQRNLAYDLFQGRNPRDHDGYELQLSRRDGRQEWVLVSPTALIDDRGEFAGVVAMVHDITDRKRTTEALEKSEALKRGIVESALDCVITIDGDGNVCEFNPAAEATFGYTRDQAIDRKLADLIVPPSLREGHRAGLARASESGEGEMLNRRLEITAMRADGTEFPIELAITRVSADPPLFTGFLRDITERVQSEELRGAQYAVTGALADAATLADAVRRVFPIIAPAARCDLGRLWLPDADADEMRSTERWSNRPEARDRNPKPVRLSESLVGSAFGSKAAVWSHEIAPPDARALGMRRGETGTSICFPILEGPYGAGVLELVGPSQLVPTDELLGLLNGVGRQLGQFKQRKDAERQFQWQLVQQAAVAELGERALEGADLSELMDAVAETIVENLEVEYAAVFRLDPSAQTLEIQAGRGWREGFVRHATIPAGLGSPSGLALDTDRPVIVLDLRTDTRFSRPRLLLEHDIVSGIAVPVRGREEPYGTIAAHTTRHRTFNRDEVHFLQSVANVLGAAIAAERAKGLEAQLHQSQRLEAVGQLAGGVAHDFNNLLSVILNYSQFAIEELGPDSSVRRDIEEIKKAAERAADFTRQLLTFSRREPVKPEVVAINSVVPETERLLRRMLPEHIELRTKLAEDAWPVKIGASQLEQVLINLAVNARDAMPEGGTITIEAANVELGSSPAAEAAAAPPGRYLQLVVSDTGVGMSEETAAQAFDPFFTTKPKGEGTGLGLATVHGIALQAGGFVQLYSEPGIGSSVKLYLPATADPIPGLAGESVVGSLDGRGETVLLVEDEQQVRALTERILTEHGYSVITAADGREAIEECLRRANEVDLLLTDVVMPHMSGPDLAVRLRSQQPDLTVIFMSGYTGEAMSRHEGLPEDVALVEKPFDQTTLLRSVSEALERTRTR